MNWDDEKEIEYVIIEGQRVDVPHSLSYGLSTGYIDLDFCLKGISEEEAEMFYGIDAKTLSDIIKIWQKDNNWNDSTDEEDEYEYNSDDINEIEDENVE